MAKMIIDIPNEDINAIKIMGLQRTQEEVQERVDSAIQHGTVLPKGYGRLIDARAFEATMYHQAFETDSDMQKWDSGCWIRYKMFENAIGDAPTILEADKRR